MQFLLLILSCTACVKPAQVAALLNPGFILKAILCQQTFASVSEYIGTHVAPTNVEPMTCCIWADTLPCPVHSGSFESLWLQQGSKPLPTTREQLCQHACHAQSFEWAAYNVGFVSQNHCASWICNIAFGHVVTLL